MTTIHAVDFSQAGIDSIPEDRPLTGAALLDAVHAFIGRFVAYPSRDAQVAHALWIVHTHLLDEFESTPRIAFLSPERASGKTRAIEVTETLVPRPILAINVTSAYLFRKIADPDGRPTILYDEIDTVFGPKAKEHEDLRGVLNAGHRRGAVAGRCVVRGKLIETEELPAYCAVGLAGLGDLPDTILSRSVIVGMKRRAPGEMVEPYRTREHVPEGNALRDQIAAWAKRVRGALGIPTMPEGVTDRDADVWEPLLAVADLVGGDWPERARVAAVTLVTLSKAGGQSLGVRLLSDVRDVFGNADTMFTKDLLSRLHDLEESPWKDMKGKPLNDRGIANLLKRYGVKSTTVRIGTQVAKGYTREGFHDPWLRYLSSPLSLSLCNTLLALHPKRMRSAAEGDRGAKKKNAVRLRPLPQSNFFSIQRLEMPKGSTARHRGPTRKGTSDAPPETREMLEAYVRNPRLLDGLPPNERARRERQLKAWKAVREMRSEAARAGHATRKALEAERLIAKLTDPDGPSIEEVWDWFTPRQQQIAQDWLDAHPRWPSE